MHDGPLSLLASRRSTEALRLPADNRLQTTSAKKRRTVIVVRAAMTTIAEGNLGQVFAQVTGTKHPKSSRFSRLFKGLARDPKIPSCIY